MESEQIPSDVLAVARAFAGLDETAELYAVEITMGAIHRARPRLANALHLWRVDLPGSDEIAERREREYETGDDPAYTNELTSVFVVQLADGTYATDGALYDEDAE